MIRISTIGHPAVEIVGFDGVERRQIEAVLAKDRSSLVQNVHLPLADDEQQPDGRRHREGLRRDPIVVMMQTAEHRFQDDNMVNPLS